MSKSATDHGSRLAPIYAWLTIISFLIATGILVFQAVAWSSTGDWQSITMLDGLERAEQYFGTEAQFYQIRGWLDQWSGLRSLLDWFPLSWAFAIVGMFWLALAATG